MNILIISTPNPYKTSGIVAFNLYRGLKGKGHNTKVLTKLYDEYNDEDIVSMETPFDILKQRIENKYITIRNRFKLFAIKKIKTNSEYHIQDFDQTKEYYSTKSILKKVKFKPDIIFYLFQQNFLTAKNLYELNTITGAQIFWYLMDTAPLTGICHYSWSCDAYTNGCGNCPALYSTSKNDQSAINFRYKQQYLSKTNISIITPTEWQTKKAEKSLLFKDKPLHKVLLSIDPVTYNFIPKAAGKKNLGIPVDKKVIFFGSTSVSDKRKGMNYLVEAFQILKGNFYKTDNNILLLIAGNFDPLISLPFECKNLGLLQTSEQLASAYQAADVFVCPSIEDSGPMMINQSIMTGTPVVSFDMGVAEDLVITGTTGYRAKLMDSHDLAKGINAVISSSEQEHQVLCENSRSLALSNFTFDIATEKIIELFQSGSNL